MQLTLKLDGEKARIEIGYEEKSHTKTEIENICDRQKRKKDKAEQEQRRKYPISELVTVTALTEERGESFIKAAHDFMTVTYLYCFDLNCLNQKMTQKFSHTHGYRYSFISLNNLLISKRKSPSETVLGYKKTTSRALTLKMILP